MTVANPWWGSWFPDAAGVSRSFGSWFPDGVTAATIIQPTGPGGAATFLLLESGSKITYSWATDVQKTYSGKEYRPQALDDPKRTFVGSATLLGDATRTMRTRLARFAAIGSTFLIAVPFEAISITANSTGKMIPTTDTTSSDWAAVGQRVAVVDGNGNAIDATVQALTASSITIDVAPGSLGNRGGMIMPTVPVFLDPQMTFDRFRVNAVERWNLNARAAVFGWPINGRAAFAALADFAIVPAGNLANVVIKATAVGAQGNSISIRFLGDLTGTTAPYRTGTGNTYVFHFSPANTTSAAMVAVINGTVTLTVAGSYKPTVTLTTGDAIGPFALSNGSDLSYGPMGAGATIATYAGRPVWTKGVQVEQTANDSIQSLAEIVDLGGIPISIGTAKQADWGRALYLNRTSLDDWQWIKAFLSTVRGRQRAFWCSSWRADLLPALTTIAASISASAALTAATGALHNVVLSVTTPGMAGNAYTIRFVSDGASIPFLGYDLTNSGTAYTFHFTPTVTTVGTMVSILSTRGFTVGGTWSGSATLSTGGNDEILTFIAFAGGSDTHLTVFGPSDAAGGIDAWSPSQRDRLSIRQTDGTLTHAQVISIVDNHDGTQAVGLVLDSAPSSAPIDLVSWLELCRMESDNFEFTWTDATFTFNTQARVIQQ